MSQELITSVEFSNLRIPYHRDLAELGVDNVGWKVLQETIFPNAKTLDSIVMALIYCRKRNLDIFKRPVHIVPMWSSAANAMIDTIWPSISELRTTAARTGEYAGRDETEFGPDVRHELGNNKLMFEFPEWARVTVYRMVKGQRCRFVGPKVYWIESYARKKRDDETPNEMWERRRHGQIEKCAEAGALRGAFPEELGNEYCAEEMEGQRIYDARPVERVSPIEPPIPPESPKPPMVEHKQAISMNAMKTERREHALAEPAEPAGEALAESAPHVGEPSKPALLIARYAEEIAMATDGDQLDAIWKRMIEPHLQSLGQDLYERLCAIDDQRRYELESTA